MAESAPRVPPHAVPSRRPIIVSNTSFGPFVDLVNGDEHGNNISTTSLTPSPSITAFAGGGGVPSPPTSIPSSVMRRARSSSRVVGAAGQTSMTIATATSIPVRQGGRSDSQASISGNIKMAADGGNEVSRSSFAEATANVSGDESNAAFVSNGSMSVQAVGRPLTPRSRPPATLTRQGSSSSNNTYNSVKNNADNITNSANTNYDKQAATAVAVASPLTIVVARSPLNRHTPTTISRSSDSAYPVPKTPTSTSKRIAAKDEALSSNTKQQQEQQPVPSANQNATEKENDYTYVPRSAEKTNTFAQTLTTANEIPDDDEERDAITAGTPQVRRKNDGDGQQKKGDDTGINTNNNAASPDAIRRFEERVRLYSATRSLRTEGKLYGSAVDAAADTPLTEDSTANANNHRMIGAIMKTPVAYVRSVNNGQAVLYHVSKDNGRSEEDVRSAAVASTRAPSAAEDHNLTEHRTQEKQLFIDTTDHNVVSARRLGIVPSTSFSPSEATSAADSLVKSNNKLVYSYEFEAALATVKARVSRTEREELSHSKMKDVTGTQQSEADEVVLITARIGSGICSSSSAEMRMRKGGNDYTQNYSSSHAAASSPSSFVSAADRFASTVTPYPSPSFSSRRDAGQQRTVTETLTRPMVAAAPSSPSKGLFGNMYDDNNNYRYTNNKSNNNNNISTISGVSPLLRQTPYDSIATTPTNGFGRAVRMDEGTHTRILSPPPPPASAATCIGPSSSITLASREDFVAALRRREEGGGNTQRDGIHRVPYVIDRQQSNRHVAGGAAIREEGDSSATNPFDHTARPHTAAAAKGQWGAPHTNQISFAASTANTRTGTTSFGGEFSVANDGDSGTFKARSLHAEDRHYSYSIANSHYLNPRYAYAADSTSALAAPPPALTGAKVERHAYGAEPTSPNYARAVKQANEVDVSLSNSTSRRPRLTSVETIH